VEIGADLQWREDCPLHVMGAYAALQLGPDALNLAGARVGAERLVELLTDLMQPPSQSQPLHEMQCNDQAPPIATKNRRHTSASSIGIQSNYYSALFDDDDDE
jgi:hypothetical protein